MHMRIWCTTSYSYSQLAAAGHGHIRTARSTDISRKPGDLPVYRLASYISCSASATVHGMLASDRSRSIWDIDIPRAWARDLSLARARLRSNLRGSYNIPRTSTLCYPKTKLFYPVSRLKRVNLCSISA